MADIKVASLSKHAQFKLIAQSAAGGVNERLPMVTDGLVAHFPFDLTLAPAAGADLTEDWQGFAVNDVPTWFSTGGGGVWSVQEHAAEKVLRCPLTNAGAQWAIWDAHFNLKRRMSWSVADVSVADSNPHPGFVVAWQDASNYDAIYLRPSNGEWVWFKVRAGGSTTPILHDMFASGAVTTGEWYAVTATLDDTGVLLLEYNGQMVYAGDGWLTGTTRVGPWAHNTNSSTGYIGAFEVVGMDEMTAVEAVLDRDGWGVFVGQPSTNLGFDAAGTQTHGSPAKLYTNGITTDLGGGRWRLDSSAGESFFRMTWLLANLTNAETYTVSFKKKVISGPAPTYLISDWCDTSVFNRKLIDYPGYTVESAAGIRSTYDSTFRFTDFAGMTGVVVEIWDIQLTRSYHAPGTELTPRTSAVSSLSLGTQFPLPTDHSLAGAQRSIAATVNSHLAVTKEGNGFTFYEDGVPTTAYEGKWSRQRYHRATVNYSFPGADNLKENLTDAPDSNYGIYYSFNADKCAFLIRTFVYSDADVRVWHRYGMDNGGYIRVNGRDTQYCGGHASASNPDVYIDLKIGWNCIEMWGSDGDGGGTVFTLVDNTQGLNEDRTTSPNAVASVRLSAHPNVKYQTSRLPIDFFATNTAQVNFTRASTALLDGDSYAVNTPRFVNVAGTTGLLSEEYTQNVRKTIFVDGLGYTGSDGGGTTMVASTEWTYTGAPVIKHTYGGSGSINCYLNAGGSFETASSGLYSGTWYVKRADGGTITSATGYLYAAGTTNAGIPAQVVSLGGGVYKITCSRTMTVAGQVSLIGIAWNGSPSITAGTVTYIDGWHVEAKSFTTTEMPPSGVRQADVTTIPTDGVITGPTGSVVIDWICDRPGDRIISQSASPEIFQIGTYYQNASLTLWAMTASSSGAIPPHLQMYIKGATNAGWSTAPTIRNGNTNWYQPNVKYRFIVIWTGGNTFYVYTGGVKYGPYTITDPVTTWKDNKLTLGDGVYPELALYDRALTDTEMAAADAGVLPEDFTMHKIFNGEGSVTGTVDGAGYTHGLNGWLESLSVYDRALTAKEAGKLGKPSFGLSQDGRLTTACVVEAGENLWPQQDMIDTVYGVPGGPAAVIGVDDSGTYHQMTVVAGGAYKGFDIGVEANVVYTFSADVWRSAGSALFKALQVEQSSSNASFAASDVPEETWTRVTVRTWDTAGGTIRFLLYPAVGTAYSGVFRWRNVVVREELAVPMKAAQRSLTIGEIIEA